ncbi:Histone H4 acetyltransferase NuA4 complex Eaf6 [Echinococcus multilocularis]|uniref:Chromatin modification-related protein MEAF6 n=1 Tax=Echinococcus multilocularis TaxID=6211 RepID=A0A068YK17_ECHMU|nr:Histone H4 acetyltransferase NuA4 complex Eaf6 [Echinococcus multilocularis]
MLSTQENNVTMPENTHLADSRSELIDLMRQRRYLIESLANLERQIYLFEGSYLDDTAPYGNIIKGWDRYLLTSGSGSAFSVAAGANGTGDKRVRKFRDSDRLFSRSSVTSMASAANMHNCYESDRHEGSISNGSFHDSQHFEDGVSENDPKPYASMPSGKKKRRHR